MVLQVFGRNQELNSGPGRCQKAVEEVQWASRPRPAAWVPGLARDHGRNDDES